MKKITFIVLAMISFLATSCVFMPMEAEFTITNNSDTDIAYIVYYNQNIPKTAEVIEAGKTVTKSVTGKLSKFDLRDSSGGAGISWMTNDYFVKKKTAIQNYGESQSDYDILTMDWYRYNNGKPLEYTEGTYQTVETVTDSYSITFSGSSSSIACEIKAN